MIKDIFVNLSASQPDVAAGCALSVATMFDAHLTGVAFAYEPVLPGAVPEWAALDVLQAESSAAQKAAKTTADNFDETLRRTGISGEARVFTANHAYAAELFGRMARRFDLSVVAQAEPDTGPVSEWLIEGALFDSGRPVLVVPYIKKDGFKADRIMACWDGGRNAARAIADALPFLTRASAVELVIVAGEAKKGEIPGADMARHLARHGVEVEIKTLVSAGVDVPNTILSHAADSATDLIVMGAYGHSRLREFIFGGATRGILDTMTVPTLMSH